MDAAAQCSEFNVTFPVGSEIEYTDDHGKTWNHSTVVGRAIVRDGEPVVRLGGVHEFIRIIDVVPANVY